MPFPLLSKEFFGKLYIIGDKAYTIDYQLNNLVCLSYSIYRIAYDGNRCYRPGSSSSTTSVDIRVFDYNCVQ